MSVLTLLAFLTGTVLGMRFKVLILIPAIGLASIATLVDGIAHSHSASVILIASALASICLQIGYLCGIITRYVFAVARTPSRHKATLYAE